MPLSCSPRLLALLLLLLSGSLHAQWYGDNWQLSGFATLAAGTVSEPDLAFGGYRDEWTPDQDSMLGLQGSIRLHDQISLTAQVVSKGHSENGDSDYEPTLDWLFLSFDVTSETRLRLGQLRTPFYLFSETLEVGFSHVWVRPPVDVYTPLLEPLANFQGADLSHTWTTRLGGQDTFDLDLQLLAGASEERFRDFELETRPLTGATFSISQVGWKLRYALIGINTTLKNARFDPLLEGLRAVGGAVPAYNSLADEFVQEDGWFLYHGLSFSWQPGAWSWVNEAYRIQAPEQGFGTDSWGWYSSLAYTWSRYTPYVVIGAYKSRASAAMRDALAATPSGVSPQADALRSVASDIIEEVTVSEESLTLGLRTDVYHGIALKAEWQMFHFGSESTGNFFPDDPSRNLSNAGLFTVALDVVF